MIEEEPIHRGRDFAIGFFGSLFLGTLLTALLSIPFHSPIPLVVTVLAAVAAAIYLLIKRETYMGIGILSAFVAIPLLAIGSCFALFAFSGL
jgi:hypothetical protein